MKLLEKKNEESLKNKTKKTIALISFNNQKPSLYGSISFKSILYASDYDLFTIVNYDNKSLSEVKNQIRNHFLKILKRINRNDNVFFTDFKCGLNNELYQNLKHLNEIKAFYKSKKSLLTKEQYDFIKRCDDVDELMEYTRKLYILRWTQEEIRKGYKMVNKKKKTFDDAIEDNTLIKIDVIAQIDNEFIEFSNLFEFYNKDRVINEKNILVSGLKRIKELREDVKFYYDNKNYIKMLKRLFSIVRIEKKKSLIEKLIKIFNSNEGLLYQVKTGLETLVLLIEKCKKSKIKQQMNQIKSFIQILKDRTGYIYEFSLPADIYKRFDELTEINDLNKLKDGLEKLSKIILKIVNKQTLKTMRKEKINVKPYL